MQVNVKGGGMIPALKDEPKCAFPSWQYLDGSVFRDGVIPAKVGDEEDEAEGESCSWSHLLVRLRA